jgi:hypothetical protein
MAEKILEVGNKRMKKFIELIAIGATVAVLALPAVANGLSRPGTAQDQCTPENKLAWYNDFRQNFKGDTAKANELAKKWLACPETAGEEQQAAYLKNFVTLYEKATRKDRITDFVYTKKDYAKAFELGKQILADEPENLKVLIDLSYAGYASNNPSYSADTMNYAKKAIQLIESGKAPDAWNPYVSKDEALGYLYNAVASLTVQKDPGEALKALIKAAQFEGKIKKLPTTFANIAGAYNDGPYAKLSADYEARFKGKDETPESKLALENINQMMDRMIDALARAVALAGNDPAYAANKKGWMETLTGWYKFRHNDSDAGLNEMISSILSKPLPPEPTPLTALPVSASGAGEGSPATGTTTASGASAPAGTAAKPATTPATGTQKPATTTTATTPAANTANNAATPAKTTAAKPKPKRNHRP